MGAARKILQNGRVCLALGAWALCSVILIGSDARAEEPAPNATTTVESDAASVTETETAVTEIKLEPGDPAVEKELARKPDSIWTMQHLTGDWGGVRTTLEDAGISFRLTYNQQFMVNMRGGRETSNGFGVAGSGEINVLLDFGKMNLIPNGEFFIRGKGTYGGEVTDFNSEKIGSIFPPNADAAIEEPIFVEKWWYRQRLLDNRIEFRLGRLVTAKDLFDTSEIAGSEDINFMNRALTFNPLIPHRNGLGAYVNVWPTDWLYVRAAVVDPQSKPRTTGFDTAFHEEDRAQVFWEFGYLSKIPTENGILPGRYRAGSWYRPGPLPKFFDDLDGLRAPRSESDDVGLYLGFDQMIWKENADAADKQGISMFARYGYAHGDVNRLEHFWSVGGQYAGLIPGRDKDVLGFGVAQGILSDDYRAVLPRADRETVYELYYAYQLAPWMVITPDLQVITNPGGSKDDRDTFIAGLRLRILF